MSVYDCDIAIIGAGIQGLFTSYLAMHEHPEYSVAVFERADIASGASGFAPGIQLAFGRSEAERNFARAGQFAWEQVFARWKWRAGRKLVLHWITKDVPVTRAAATEELQQLAVPNEMLIGDNPLKIDPGQHMLRGYCSYDPVRLVSERLHHEIIKRGVQLHVRTVIKSIENHRPDRLTLVTTEGRHFTCRYAVVAIGPWATDTLLTSLCHSAKDIRIKKVVALMIDHAPAQADTAIGFADDYAFLLPMLEKRQWLFSFSSDDWDVSPKENVKIDKEDIAKAQCILTRYGLPLNFDIDFSPCFCDTYTKNGLPRVVSADNDSRIVFVIGAAGNGFRFAPPLAAKALNKIFSGV